MIKLTNASTYKLIPEGRTTFKIKNVVHDANNSKVEVDMLTEDGLRHIERFHFTYKDGTFNQGGLNAFGAFARAATGVTVLDQIEPEDLIDCYVSANVMHVRRPNRNDPTRTVTLINLKSYTRAQPWGRETQVDDIEF